MLRQGGKRRDGLDRTIREWRVLGHSKREEMLFRQRPDPIQGKIAFPSARPSIRPGLDPGLLGTRGGRSHTRQRSSPWVASDQSRSESLIIPVTHCYSLRKNLSSKSAKPKTQDQSSNRMQIFSIPGPSLTAFGNGLPFSSFQTKVTVRLGRGEVISGLSFTSHRGLTRGLVTCFAVRYRRAHGGSGR